MLRCVHESQLHKDNCFLTLTYDDEHLPYGGTLVPRDCVLFLKRLRFANRHQRISYFLCGEYGETTQRPHYHALIFGLDFFDGKNYGAPKDDGTYLRTSPALDALWRMGETKVGSLTPESAGYVSRYAMKKITGDLAARHYEYIDPETGEILQRVPEFARMSRNPAIGKRWFQQFKHDIYPDDTVIYAGGRKAKVPAYYDKLYAREGLQLHTLKLKRKEDAATRKSDATPARLKVRAEVKAAQIKQLKRSL